MTDIPNLRASHSSTSGKTAGLESTAAARACAGAPHGDAGLAILRTARCAAQKCRARRAHLADEAALHANAGLAALVERAEDELGHHRFQLALAEVLDHARRVATQLLRQRAGFLGNP